jgi:hypothetical protein
MEWRNIVTRTIIPNQLNGLWWVDRWPSWVYPVPFLCHLSLTSPWVCTVVSYSCAGRRGPASTHRTPGVTCWEHGEAEHFECNGVVQNLPLWEGCWSTSWPWWRRRLWMCNSITLDRPLAHTRARTRDPLHTSTTVTHEASLPISPQKPRPLQSKGNFYFKVSEQVTSPIETLFRAHHR